ncbi:CHAP domain-containing protein [Leucobacter massiliensis]|uniref:CHAP domain-containing protein n=1 Tax=Leucobacter massiliensis TaxID=1686285 RepID=UPI001FEBDE6A|nr:CHAP domain-containing protein [Leucobacter massiliensis]
MSLVSTVIFAFGAAPAMAEAPVEDFSLAAVQPATTTVSQSLDTGDALAGAPIESVLSVDEVAHVPHHFDVDAAISLAESEVGTSRATGWNQPGECIMSAQRWIRAGGGNWGGGGDPVSNYDGATRVTLAQAEPGDVVQYEYVASPTSWVTGVHTVLITEVHDDGTFTIIESNNPGGSGLVSKDENWTPAPPAGFQAAVWRF